jgi:hypothetical protein
MSTADGHRLPYWFDLALDILGVGSPARHSGQGLIAPVR